VNLTFNCALKSSYVIIYLYRVRIVHQSQQNKNITEMTNSKKYHSVLLTCNQQI